MQVTKNEKYTLVKPSQNLASSFFTIFKNEYPHFVNEHLIIDFSENINIQIEEIILFLDLSVQHKTHGTSFVIIANNVNIDSLPEELSVVPTLTEATDILEMEAIERDLGF